MSSFQPVISPETMPSMGFGIEIEQTGLSYENLQQLTSSSISQIKELLPSSPLGTFRVFGSKALAPVLSVGAIITPNATPVAIAATTAVGAGITSYELTSGTANAQSSSSTVPSKYQCPADVIKMGKTPLFSTNVFGGKSFVIPPDPNLVDLMVVSDRSWESLTGDPVSLPNECVKQVLPEQYEVVNNDLTPATNTVFEVHLPNPESSARITGISELDGSRDLIPNQCTISPDQTSVSCDMGTMAGGEYKIFRVNWSADKAIVGQPIQASINSSVADRDPSDNVVSYSENIYPELINPFAPGSKPVLHSLPSRRVNSNCYVRPFSISSKVPILNGKIQTLISFINKRGSKNIVHHKMVRKSFADISTRPTNISVRVCGKNTKVDASVKVSASNLQNGTVFSTTAHLRKIKSKGKKPQIVWRNEPWS